MVTPCLRPDDLPAMAGCAADDPRRRHLETCPACRALLLAYEEFQAGAADGELAGLDQADARLTRRLKLATARARSPRRWPGKTRSWLLAAAVVLAVVGGSVVVRDLVRLDAVRPGRIPPEMRGETVADPRWEAQGQAWRLTWPDAPPGRQHAVFLTADLTELARRPLDGGLALDAVPPDAAYVQLVVLAGTDTLARSNLVAAEPPAR